MEAKHTSGEWFAVLTENGGRVFTEMGVLVDDIRGFDAEQRQANAHLISAAPDLLEVAKHCENMLMRYEINRINREEIEDEALSKIRAAIKKATGEA